METLGIAASVVGVVGPALHLVRQLVDDIQMIVDAPGAVKSLKDELLTIEKALTSLQVVSDRQWESLGETVVSQSKAATALCKESCEKFRNALGRWTRHSDGANGKLSWRDRATVGFFKQSELKSMTEQLQNSKVTLTWVATVATLHSSLQQSHVTEEVMATVSSTEAKVTSAIKMVDGQLAEVNDRLTSLVLAQQDQDQADTEADRASAIRQVAVERTSLSTSRSLLEELVARIQVAVADAQRGQGRVEIKFGDHNRGSQVGQNSGTITNTFSGLY